MGKNRLLINLTSNIISYSTTVLITFFLTPYLIRTLGKDAYSFYPLANSFVNYMSILTIALNSMASRFITIELVKKNKVKANKYFVSVLYSNIIMSGILIIPMSVIVIFLEKILDLPINLFFSVKFLFVLVFLSMIVNVVTSVFGVAVFAKNRIDLRSVIEIIQGILRVVLYLILFTFFKPNIFYVGLIALSLSICYFVFNFIFTKKLLPDMKLSPNYFDFAYVKEVLFSGVWNSVEQLGAVLLSSLSLLICNIYLGAKAAGDYSIILTVPNFIIGVIAMITAVFMPIITQRYAEGNIKLLITEIHNSQKIMAIISSVPIVIFMVIGIEFYSLWVPGEDAQKLQLLSIMTIIPMIITGAAWPLSNLNSVLNRVRIPSIVTIGCGLVNIGFTLILITFTNMGIYSIAIASLAVNIFRVAIFIPLYPCLILKIRKTTFYPTIFRTVFCSGLNFIIFLSIKTIIDINNWLEIFSFCLICGIIGLLVCSLVIFKKNELLDLTIRLNRIIFKKRLAKSN